MNLTRVYCFKCGNWSSARLSNRRELNKFHANKSIFCRSHDRDIAAASRIVSHELNLIVAINSRSNHQTETFSNFKLSQWTTKIVLVVYCLLAVTIFCGMIQKINLFTLERTKTLRIFTHVSLYQFRYQIKLELTQPVCSEMRHEIAVWTSWKQISLSRKNYFRGFDLSGFSDSQIFAVTSAVFWICFWYSDRSTSYKKKEMNRTERQCSICLPFYLRIQSTSIRSQTAEICSICFPSVQTNPKQSAETNSTINVRATSSCFLTVKWILFLTVLLHKEILRKLVRVCIKTFHYSKTLNVNDSKWFFSNSRVIPNQEPERLLNPPSNVLLTIQISYVKPKYLQITLKRETRARGWSLIDFKLYLIVQLHENCPGLKV